MAHDSRRVRRTRRRYAHRADVHQAGLRRAYYVCGKLQYINTLAGRRSARVQEDHIGTIDSLPRLERRR